MVPIERNEPWEEPRDGSDPRRVEGLDAELALAAHAEPGRLISFVPDAGSDLARVLGSTSSAAASRQIVALDMMWCVAGQPRSAQDVGGTRRSDRTHEPAETAELPAVGTAVFGTPPDRLRWSSRSSTVRVALDGRQFFAGKATTVVVASGEFLRGADLVPRGHPGDGRLEVQVYDLPRGQRRAMRDRLSTADHVPHPRIRQGTGRRVEITLVSGVWPFEADGVPRAPASGLEVVVLPGALRLLV